MATLGKDGTSLEVTYETPIGGTNKLIKKKVKRKGTLNLVNILIIDQEFDEKGKLDESKCRIYYDSLGWLVLEEPYKEMSEYKLGHQTTIKGFQ